MSLADLASLGSFVSGVAVVITLVFLVVQLRQNTAAVKAGSSQALSATYQEITNIVVSNGDMARIWRLGQADLDTLTDDERVRFVAYLSTVFRFLESTRLQWRRGQLDNEHWQALASDFKDLAMQPGIRGFWTLRRHQYSQEFCSWLEALPQSETVPAMYGPSTMNEQISPS